MRNILYLIVFWASTIQAAHALAEVKEAALITTSTVTLGDLLDNLETGHDIWVMNAPAPGQKTSISTKYLASLTRQHDVYWQNSRAVRHIIVTRKGQSIPHSALEPLIMGELDSLPQSHEKRGIRFDNKNTPLYLPEDATAADVTLQKFTYSPQSGKFSALVSVPADGGKYTTATIRGRTHAISMVPVLNKTITPGQEITARDIGWVPLPTLRIGRNIIRDKNQVVGMTPRRGLRNGVALRLSDLARPEIIRRGKMVNILFTSGKIRLSAIGKAIESGGRGDVIRVMNSKSHKTLDAVVIGPGQVQVVTAQLTALP